MQLSGAAVIQFKCIGGNGSSNKIYVANLYFWKAQPVGIEKLDLIEFNVYPNPTKDIWNLKGEERIEFVQMFDLQGKVVTSAKVNAVTTSINATELNNGVYFVRVGSASGINMLKLIKR